MDHPPLTAQALAPYAPPQPAGDGNGATPAPNFSAPERAVLHALVARCLRLLADRLDDVLPGALTSARQAWDSVDDLKMLDPSVVARVNETRKALRDTLATGGPTARAVALEGLLAVDAAWGLTSLFERRLSSLIRLRVRSGETELLPEGRPFLDLATALHEAARAWS